LRRHFLASGILWFGLTVLGELLVAYADPMPPGASEESTVVRGAFHLLAVLAVPVFSFVLSVLFYSLLRFRAPGPEADGQPIYGSTTVAALWLAITTGLAIYVIFNPGLSGLAELWRPRPSELLVRVEAQQWNWTVSYPQYRVTIKKAKEMPLPVGKRVLFEITSSDVVHSFWIPAFQMKMDAVPGLTTTLALTPAVVGSFSDDPGYRVQCAELCGTGHATMSAAVRVMEFKEFEATIAKLKAQQSSGSTATSGGYRP
jgi:cytochrome c oxidase subunit 2